MNKFKETDIEYGTGTRYTDRETGAWIEVRIDQNGGDFNPILDMEGVDVAYTGHSRTRYTGTVELPEELEVECSCCDGNGTTERRELVRGGRCVASGSLDAMGYLFDREMNVEEPPEPPLHMIRATCPKCKGFGTIDTEDLGEFLRSQYGALAFYEFECGPGITAVLFLHGDRESFGPDLDTYAKAYAEEYKSWATGDIYWAEDMEGERCHGLIGDSGVESFLDDTMPYLIEKVHERVNNNIILGYN